MKIFLIGLLIIILTIIQVSLIPVNLLLSLIIFFTLVLKDRESLILALVMGLLLDIFSHSVMGSSSIGFLLVWGGIIIYRYRFSFVSKIIIMFFTLFSYFLFQLVTGKFINFNEALLLIILILILSSLFSDSLVVQRKLRV